MKLLATSAELKALRTICGERDRIASQMLALVGKDSFYYKPSAEAYKLIMSVVKETGNPPDWSQVIADPSIGEDARKILKGTSETPAISKDKVSSIAKTLDKFRKLRGLVAMAQTVLDNVEDNQVDLDELIESTSESLVKVRSRGDAKAQLFHYGRGNNTTALVKESLYGKKKPSVPTGWHGFDDRNGGILHGSLVLLAANTGGGKCLTAESKITLADGSYASIKDLWDAAIEIPVPTDNGVEKKFVTPLKLMRRDGKVVDAVGMYKTTGTSVKLTLSDGRVLRGRPTHPVKIERDGAVMWCELQNLLLTDEVLVSSDNYVA